MVRLSQRILGLVELIISSAVHLLYGFYIFSTAVAWDLSQALTGTKTVSDERKEEEEAVLDGSVSPIVLVHGIFGFGQGVCVITTSQTGLLECSLLFSVGWHWIMNLNLLQRLGGLSYFAGAEKKDEHVLVPDLGSLTSVHDRCLLIQLFVFWLQGLILKLWICLKILISERENCSIIWREGRLITARSTARSMGTHSLARTMGKVCFFSDISDRIWYEYFC